MVDLYRNRFSTDPRDVGGGVGEEDYLGENFGELDATISNDDFGVAAVQGGEGVELSPSSFNSKNLGDFWD
ncbi:hypothetical protein U1Q18_010823 [Sarracenia purpurea var. burkii]